MNVIRPSRARDIFLLSGGVILLAYIISRAFNVSVQADEACTWQLFASKGEVFPSEYNYFTANNHPLNTALMWLFEKMFGMSQFVLRLPNVLAGCLYIFCTAMMVRRMPSPLIGCLAFVIMNTNPFMIQYFNVARGYGLAAGFMALAFWQLWIYFDGKHAFRNLLIAVSAATLAVFANYTYLNLFLPLAGFTGVFILFHKGEHQLSLRRKLLHAGVLAAVTLTVLGVVMTIGNKIKAGGGFWSSNLETFWEGSIGSVMDGILFNTVHDTAVINKWVIFAGELYFIAAIVTLARYAVMRKEGTSLFPLFVLTTLTLSAVSVILQHEWLGLEYPVQRIGLFMVWPLLVLISLAAGLSQRNTWITVGPIAALTALLSWHFASTASAWSESFHPTSEQLYQTVQELRNENPDNDVIHIVTDPVIISCGLDYYKTEFDWYDLDVIRAEDRFDFRLCKYCYVSRDYVSRVTAPFWEPIRTFANGNVLFRNKTLPAEPLVSHLVIPPVDTITTLNEKNGCYGREGIWPDSVADCMRMMCKVETEISMKEDARARLWITVYRGEQEVYVQYSDLEAFGTGEDWQKIEVEMAMPYVMKNDKVVAFVYYGHGVVQLKKFRVNVEVY